MKASTTGENMTHTKDEVLNIAGQCRATASSPLAKTIAVDGGSGLLCELLLDAAKVIEALAAPVQEPFGYLFQHEETGLTMVVDVQQVEWGFEKNNPRHQKIGPVYTTPPAQPAVQETVAWQDELALIEAVLKGYPNSMAKADALRAVRVLQAATPAQPAPVQPVEWEHHAKKLTQWLHCMSYNDSYFGEPAGLVKQVTASLNRLIGTTPPAANKPWIGLTPADKEFIELTGGKSDVLLVELIEAKLKALNYPISDN
jgi:hypothetical protein